MMTEQIVGWFILGFVVAAMLLYGPVMAKAYWVKAQGLAWMKDGNAKLRESTAKEKGYALIERERSEFSGKELEYLKREAEHFEGDGKLQNQYLALLDEHNKTLEGYSKLAEEYLADIKKYNALMTKHEELAKDHKALLWRAGGGVEGTA